MAEITLAVIPLCFEAFRLGKALRSHLTTFRTYMNVVEEHRVNLAVQVCIFVSECQGILEKASTGCLNANTTRVMNQARQLRRGDSDSQTEADVFSPEIEESLQSMFGSSMETLLALLKVILRKICTITDDLGRYGEPDHGGHEIGAGSAMSRTQNRITLMLGDKTYAKTISELTTLILNLQELRKRATVETADNGHEARRRTPHDATRFPAEDRVRGQDAALLLQGMTAKWSCSQEAHVAWTQEVKLLLSSTGESALSSTTPTCLDVFIQKETSRRDLSSNCFCVVPMPKQSSIGLLSPASSSVDEDPTTREPKRQRISTGKAKKSGPTEPRSPECHSTPGVKSNGVSSANFMEAGDMCSRLCGFTDKSLDCSNTTSLHYSLDVKNRTFAFSDGHTTMSQKETVSLQDILLQEAIHETLSHAERFWLASIIVKSALRHFNTGWWAESWTLDELRFYDLETDDLMDSLRTLHLSSPLPTCQRAGDRDTPMAGHAATTSSKGKAKDVSADALGTEMMEVGIRNLTLWGVGVALLQIGLGRPISWHDHVAVRRSISDLDRFSGRYGDITEKLINCDFGKGARLQKLELQNEIYRTVVCELEDTLKEFKEAGLWGM